MNFATAHFCNRALSKTSALIQRSFIPLHVQTTIHKIRLGIVQHYLAQRYGALIKNYQTQDLASAALNAANEKIIWVCWLQGLDQAPQIVKKCIANLHLFHGEDCSIRLITLENYKNFVTLPKHIEEKFQKQQMKPAHFSDVLRLCLLAKHGGAWIDSTVLILKSMPADVFSSPFFTLKSHTYAPESSISMGKWTTFFLGATREYTPILFLRDLLIQYWQDHDKELDYFLFDHAISIAYQHFPHFKNALDKLAYFGDHRHLLMPLLLTEYTEEANKLIAEDPIQIYKLTYKIDHVHHIGQHSFYQHYIQ